MFEVEKPWGKFQQFAHNEYCTVKLLHIKAGEELSYQSHEKRDEYWYVAGGSGTVVLDDATHPVRPGSEVSIGRKQKHKAVASEDLIILEISTGEFDEDDITRYSDRYGRPGR